MAVNFATADLILLGRERTETSTLPSALMHGSGLLFCLPESARQANASVQNSSRATMTR